MILSRQCEKDFKEWLAKTYDGDVLSYAVGWDNGGQDILEFIKNFYPFYDRQPSLPITMLYALIVEWFDSLDVIIDVFMVPGSKKWNHSVKKSFDGTPWRNSRTEALKAAIERANEIYNEQKQ